MHGPRSDRIWYGTKSGYVNVHCSSDQIKCLRLFKICIQTIGIKLSIFYLFFVQIFSNTKSSKLILFLHNKGVCLIIAKDVLTNKIGKLYICLMHFLSRNWHPLDGPKVNVHNSSSSCCPFCKINSKIKWTTLPSFNRIK